MRGTIDPLDELFATLSYDKPRVIALHFKISEGYTLLMLITTFILPDIVQKLRLVKVGFPVLLYIPPLLLWLNGEQYILPCLINTIIGCFNGFGGTVWFVECSEHNRLLRKNAHDASEAYQKVILAQQHFTSGGTVAGKLLPIRYAALMRQSSSIGGTLLPK